MAATVNFFISLTFTFDYITIKHMLDSSQILIVAAVTIMTAILTIVGIQLILVLKEVRQGLKRINGIVDSVEKIGFSVTHGSTEILGFMTGVKKLFSIIDVITEHTKKKKNGTSK